MQKLNSFLPAHWSKSNPIDIIGDSDENVYQKAIEVCLDDPNIDSILVICVPQVVADPNRLAEKIIDLTKNQPSPYLLLFQVKQAFNIQEIY